MASLSEHERGDSQQVRHVRHLRALAKADVNLTCVVYGLGEARCQLDGIFHKLLYPDRCNVLRGVCSRSKSRVQTAAAATRCNVTITMKEVRKTRKPLRVNTTR